MKYKSNSRENQDLFVLSVLDKKQNGTYLEIGSAYPILDNNTYLLESEFNWDGLSIDYNQSFVNEFTSIRRNQCICFDATIIDYNALITEYYPSTHIDYLQLDIDPPSNTFKVLENIDFNKVSFSVITYEHDFYNGGSVERDLSRKILESHGYTRVISDVMHNGLVFEDWYVNETYMNSDTWKKFIGNNINMDTPNLTDSYKQIFKHL